MQFWHIFQISLVVLIINCTPSRVITYTNLFTNTIIDILDKTIHVTTIRTHASDKPWMTAYIKKEIKARQKAYTTGNMTKYRQLADKIITLIKKANRILFI